MSGKQIKRRVIDESTLGDVGTWGHIPLYLQRIFKGRGAKSLDALSKQLIDMADWRLLGDIEKAAAIVYEAIQKDVLITVSGDYDCDGATATATAVRGLKLLGAKRVKYIIPDRFKHGYGLSPALVDAMDPETGLIVTVDSGVASVEGVAYAKAKGIKVAVTDHHLPPDVLPNADAMVNPNLKDDPFPSKALAGVGVMFHLIMATMSHIKKEMGESFIASNYNVSLVPLLDLVAVGTVADLVPLDKNNRILVDMGLRVIRGGRCSEGLKALIAASGRDITQLVAQDIGYAVAPRLNAAGRLENMTLGVEALLCEDPERAQALVAQLSAINTERQEIQATMIEEAEAILSGEIDAATDAVGVTVYKAGWHAGVVGLVASKIKERLHRPVFAFAPGEGDDPLLRGSGRSIEGFHLRDALALIDARTPGLLAKFGGHAMAAGLSIDRSRLDEFARLFDEVAKEQLTEDLLQANVYTDGELEPKELSKATIELLQKAGPWGQAFPEPVFDGEFDCRAWQLMGNGHLRLLLADPRDGKSYEAVYFNGFDPDATVPPRVRVAYQLNLNRWQDKETLQLLVQHFEPL